MQAFYFSTEQKRLRYGDDRPIIVGEAHEVSCKPICCKQGLHASTDILDALMYAPSSILYLVDISGDVDERTDKIAGKRREYLAEFDAEELLKEFARKQALINIHKIKPYCSVKEFDLITRYLSTGDADAAYSAANSAEYAARSAENAASAAYSAARSAEDAANSAARSAGSAAYNAHSAARSAHSAAGNAHSAARSAAYSAANYMLTRMIKEATGWDI
jgi:hypothetical protein